MTPCFNCLRSSKPIMSRFDICGGGGGSQRQSKHRMTNMILQWLMAREKSKYNLPHSRPLPAGSLAGVQTDRTPVSVFPFCVFLFYFVLLFVRVLLFVQFSFSVSNILFTLLAPVWPRRAVWSWGGGTFQQTSGCHDCTWFDYSARFWLSAQKKQGFVCPTKKAARNIYRPATTVMTATRNPARIQPNTAPAQADWPEASKSDANTCEWSWWWCLMITVMMMEMMMEMLIKMMNGDGHNDDVGGGAYILEAGKAHNKFGFFFVFF